MKKITTVLSLFILTLLMFSCSNEKTIQTYLVESQGKNGFMTFDIPMTFLDVKSQDVSDDIKKAIKSIRKVNVVALPYQNNEDAYETEKKNLSDILNNSEKYKSLMSLNTRGIKVKIYYTGSTSSIDEVIAFGYAKEKGVGVARIIGDNMDPSMVIKVIQNLKIDGGKLNLKQFNLAF
ncbi:MAG: DUF4252 domain-containing protein [Flavobacteriaceae bacterium]|nr:DUF4252 domain-containing protein [Flavobacteriaceae bacterium]